MSCAENRRSCGAIIFWSPQDDGLVELRRYVAAELIRFGKIPPEFHTFDLAPKRKVHYILPDASLYLKNGEPWLYPYHKIMARFPDAAIKVHYPTTNSPEWNSVVHGNATPGTTSFS